jgi:TRAP-type C4-dicarboxylate transport system permease small subunit
MLSRHLTRLARLFGGLAALAVLLLALLVIISIVSRLAGVYIGGLTEGAGYCMAAAGSFGLAYTFLQGGHIRVDIVLNLLPRRVRLRVEQLAVILSSAFAAFLAWFLCRMVIVSWQFGDVSGGSDALPLWIPQLPVALGFTVFAVVMLWTAIDSIIHGRAPIDTDSGGLLDTED